MVLMEAVLWIDTSNTAIRTGFPRRALQTTLHCGILQTMESKQLVSSRCLFAELGRHWVNLARAKQINCANFPCNCWVAGEPVVPKWSFICCESLVEDVGIVMSWQANSSLLYTNAAMHSPLYDEKIPGLSWCCWLNSSICFASLSEKLTPWTSLSRPGFWHTSCGFRAD